MSQYLETVNKQTISRKTTKDSRNQDYKKCNNNSMTKLINSV